jgi:transcriptional regulator with XRE-family HTH domain
MIDGMVEARALDTRREDGIHAVLAANLRRLRIARHLSLSELARATGMSKATLSSIESARANPTVGTLVGLARALRVELGELLEESPLGEVRIVRAAQGRPDARDGLARRVLDAGTGDGNVEIAELTLAARQSHELEPKPSGSRIDIYVLQGKLIAGPVELSTELGPGDYASFPADVPHVYQTGRQPARALLVARG